MFILLRSLAVFPSTATDIYRGYTFRKEAWPWIYVSHKYKLLYCQIPKVGSTHWLNLLGNLEGSVNGSFDKDIHKAQLMLLSYLQPVERNRVLEKYTKFMVIREPFKRLLSAYKNKLLPHKDYDFPLFYYFSQKLIYYYRSENSTFHGKYPTFEEFIDYLTDSSDYSSQIKVHYSEKRHWNPQVNLCYPCNIEYDFVLDIEDIEEETEYFFNHIGIPRFVQYPQRNRPSDNGKDSQGVFDTETKSQFSKVDPALVNALYHYYEKDYKILGFQTPPQF